MKSLKNLENRTGIGAILNERGLNGFAAEIGVAYGENADSILSGWRGLGLMLIDPWDRKKCGEYVDGSANIDFDGAFNHCLGLMAKHPMRTIAIRKTSSEAVVLFPDSFFDFVYIDGNHHNPQVTIDLLEWLPKVKSGGIFGGHDFYDLDTPHYRCDVKKAVEKMCEKHNFELFVSPGCTSWWVIKP